MAVTYDSVNQEVEVASSGNTFNDIVAAVANTAISAELIPEAGIYTLIDTKIKLINASSGELIDSESTLYHTKNATWPGTAEPENRTMHFEFSGSVANGVVELGKDNGTSTKPETYEDCWYYYDNLVAAGPGNVFWTNNTFGHGEPGTWRQYGGIIDFMPRGATTAGQFLYMPSTEVRMHGVNSERFGGWRLWGTNYTCREVICKGGANGTGSDTGPYSFSLGGVSAVADGLFDIIIQNNKYGYYFYDVNGGTMRDVRLRENNGELTFNAAQTGMLVDLIDCDPYTNIATVGTSSGTYTVRELTSYNILCQDEVGSNLQNVRVRLWRDTPSTVELINELTDVNGVPVSGEQLLLVTDIVGSTVFGDQTQYGPYFIRTRDYGRLWYEQTKIPDPPSPLTQTFVMQATGLTQDGTDDTTVSGYTGIVFNEGTTTIEITEAHTLQDIYSYGQYHFQLSAQMDFAQVDLPFTTFEGSTFTILSPWTMSNIDSLVDVELVVLVLANGNRWVPIQISNVESRSGYRITEIGGSVLYLGTIDEDGLDRFRTKTLYTADVNVAIQARLQGYANFGAPEIQNGIIANTGLIVAVNSRLDDRYKVPDGRVDQAHFRIRNDDGTEITATWKQAEDTDHTGQAKLSNVRLRLQLQETEGRDIPLSPTLQFRLVGASNWEDVGDDS